VACPEPHARTNVNRAFEYVPVDLVLSPWRRCPPRRTLALGVQGTSRLTSTHSLGWKGRSTESMLRPRSKAALGGEPAYPISELSGTQTNGRAISHAAGGAVFSRFSPATSRPAGRLKGRGWARRHGAGGRGRERERERERIPTDGTWITCSRIDFRPESGGGDRFVRAFSSFRFCWLDFYFQALCRSISLFAFMLSTSRINFRILILLLWI
jgi:hypothetical protein